MKLLLVKLTHVKAANKRQQNVMIRPNTKNKTCEAATPLGCASLCGWLHSTHSTTQISIAPGHSGSSFWPT